MLFFPSVTKFQLSLTFDLMFWLLEASVQCDRVISGMQLIVLFIVKDFFPDGGDELGGFWFSDAKSDFFRLYMPVTSN